MCISPVTVLGQISLFHLNNGNTETLKKKSNLTLKSSLKKCWCQNLNKNVLSPGPMFFMVYCKLPFGCYLMASSIFLCSLCYLIFEIILSFENTVLCVHSRISTQSKWASKLYKAIQQAKRHRQDPLLWIKESHLYFSLSHNKVRALQLVLGHGLGGRIGLCYSQSKVVRKG